MTTVEKETPEDSHPPIKLEGQALEDAIRKQLEFYFSRQNLATDAYLTSHMNAQKFVPIDVIANFRKIKSLTEDKDLISKVARQCKNLACDETGRMVRPTLKMERKTLLLRDIPSSTPVEEVRAIFDKNCGKVVGIRGDIGDTWYVSFETEEECVDTAMQLVGKTFQGKPIHCRIKSENLLRGYFFHPGQPKDASPSRFRDGPPVNNNNNNGFVNVPFGYVPYPDQSYMIPYSQPWQNNVYPPVDPSQPQQDYPRGRGRRTDPSQPRKGHGPPFQTGPRRKKGYRKQRTGDPSAKGAPRQPEPQLGPEHFPALPTTKKPPPTTAGYTKPFRKYSREQMSEIALEMGRKGIARPETYPPSQDCLVVRTSANTACQLMEPFPVIYPASPSPFLAAQPHHSSELPPFFDLDTGLPEGLGVLDPSALPDPSVLPFEQIHPEMQYLPHDEPIDIPSQEIDDSGVQFSSSPQVGAESVEHIPPTETDQQPTITQSTPSTPNPPTTVQTTSKPSPQHGNGNRYYSRTGRGGPRRYAQKYAQKNKFVEKTASTNTPTTPPKTQADGKTNEKKTAAAVVKAAEAAEASKQKSPPPKTPNQGVKSGPPSGSKSGPPSGSKSGPQGAKSGSQGAKGSPRSGRGRGVYKSKNRNRGGAPRFSKTDKAAYKQAGSSSSVASTSSTSSNTANLPQSPTKLTYADMARGSHPVTYKPSSSATK